MTLAQRFSAFLNAPQSSEVAVVESKAMTGAGAYVMEYHEPISRGQRDPAKYQRQCQTVSRRNPWVNTAEAIISGKGATVGWHLEDPDDETVDFTASPQAKAVQTLFERPNPQMTRSRLWSITLRHMGVCGNAFWFLDQLDMLAKTPAAIYYINPARMRPATDARGNLTGWVLDADEDYQFEYGKQSGIGLDLEEVVHFTMEPPDWGYLGHGLVEAAENLLALNGAAERYLTQVLATGGRRGHFIGPKDGRMDDDVFQSLVAGLRNVAESPDAAKRNIVTKGPLETTPQAVTPNEVGAMGVLTEMREDIVSGVWRVPLSQLGIPLPAGLNSGDARKYEEAALWQNAIEPRLHSFSETVQFQVLDRWAALGLPLNIVLETPTFDDNMPAWDILAKSENAPITWNEQRTIVGLDPLPDYDDDGSPLGIRITLPNTLSTVAAGTDEKNKTPSIKEPEPEPTVMLPETPLLTEGKAALGLRARLEGTMTPRIAGAVSDYLAAQKAEIIERLRARAEHLLRKPTDTSWWSGAFWDKRLHDALIPVVETVAVKVSTETQATLGRPAKALMAFPDAVRSFVTMRTGERITGINETTRDDVLRGVREAVDEATREGLSPAQAATLITDKVDKLATWNASRAELISRTELMNAYNDAALHSYEQFDVTHVEALDGDKDEECARRNGQRYSIEEAYGIADHPNGSLDWAPVVREGKAEVDVSPSEIRAIVAEMLAGRAPGKADAFMPSMLIPQITFSPNITVPETAVQVYEREPIVNVAAPVVNMPETVVNVAGAVVNIPEQKATVPVVQEIRIVSEPNRLSRRDVERDTSGRVVRIIEQEIDG